MTIKLVKNNGRIVPIVYCDTCSAPIDHAASAAAVFNRIDVDGQATTVQHVHKGACHNLAERRLGAAGPTGWLELRQHVYHLAHNVGLTPEKLQQMANDEKEFGSL